MPTVVIGNNTGDDYSGTEDAIIVSGATTNNYGGRTESSIATGLYLLIRFSGLLSISGPVIVSTATLSLYKNSGESSGTIELRRLLRNWIEGTLNGADRSGDSPYSCCWNEYGSENTWTTAGALSDGNDRVASSSATMSIATTTGQYYDSGNLCADVEDFINGDASNYGWHCYTTIATYGAFFRMKNYGASGTLPYLTITYTESGGATAVPVFIHHLKQQGVM